MNLDKAKMALVALSIALIGSLIATSMLFTKNYSLNNQLLNEQQKVAKLTTDLQSSNDTLDSFRTQCQLQADANDKANEQRVGAFAKQAAKCVPIMQKFGVQ